MKTLKKYGYGGRKGTPTRQPPVAPSDTLAMNYISPALQRYAQDEAMMQTYGGPYDFMVDEDLYDQNNFGRPRYRQPALSSNTIFESLGPAGNYPGPEKEVARNQEYIARMLQRIQDLANAGDPEAMKVIKEIERQNYVSRSQQR